MSPSYKPKFTITIVDNETEKYMTIGASDLEEFKKKGISGKSHVYEFIERFKDENSSNSTK